MIALNSQSPIKKLYLDISIRTRDIAIYVSTDSTDTSKMSYAVDQPIVSMFDELPLLSTESQDMYGCLLNLMW